MSAEDEYRPAEELPVAEPLDAEPDERPADRRDPYEITDKKGKDPWKPSLVKEIFSWCFWLFMLYLCTAGFIYGYLTRDEKPDNGLADTLFIPAEMLRNFSFTYQQITDWQISFFRLEKEAEPK